MIIPSWKAASLLALLTASAATFGWGGAACAARARQTERLAVEALRACILDKEKPPKPENLAPCVLLNGSYVVLKGVPTAPAAEKTEKPTGSTK